MSDQELVESFEAGQVPPGGFGHREHVRLAWLYLQREPLLPALARFSGGLRRFAALQGQPEKYHETITWAFFLLIHERRSRSEGAQGFEDFVAANADLMSWKDGALRRYYSPETLDSELARRVFVFPDLAASAL